MSWAALTYKNGWPLSRTDIDRFCDLLSEVGFQVSSDALPSAIVDPKDQPVIEAAVAGRIASQRVLGGARIHV